MNKKKKRGCTCCVDLSSTATDFASIGGFSDLKRPSADLCSSVRVWWKCLVCGSGSRRLVRHVLDFFELLLYIVVSSEATYRELIKIKKNKKTLFTSRPCLPHFISILFSLKNMCDAFRGIFPFNVPGFSHQSRTWTI